MRKSLKALAPATLLLAATYWIIPVAPISATPPPVDGSMTVLHGRASSTAVASIVATGSAGPGYVQVLPCGATPGNASNLNVDHVNQTVSGVAFVQFDASGTACVFNQTGTHLVVDIQGYMSPGSFDDLPDARILDTRQTPCLGVFMATRNETLRQLARPAGDATATWPEFSLPGYDGSFANGQLRLTSGCHAYYVQEIYKGSLLHDVSFNQSGLRSDRTITIPPVLSAWERPILAGVSADGQSVFVSAFESEVGAFGSAIWRIPLDGSKPGRFFLGGNNGQVAFAVSPDERYVYGWNTARLGEANELQRYDLLTGTSDTLPVPGRTLGALFHPQLRLSLDGTKLCLDGSSYLSIPESTIVSLPSSCNGFTSNGFILTLKADADNSQTGVLATIDPANVNGPLTVIAHVPDGGIGNGQYVSS